VSRELITRTVGAGATGWRIPAHELETAVAQAIIARLVDPEFASAAFAGGGQRAEAGSRLAEALRLIEADLRDVGSETGRAALRQVVERVDVTEDRLSAQIDLSGPGIADIGDALHTVPSFTIVQPIILVRRGAELRVVLQGAAADARSPDAALIEAIVQARVWFMAWRDPKASATISEIATRHRVDASDVSRELQLAFLAPDLVELILDGRQSTGLTTNRLRRIGDLPPLWDEQREALS
jgi:hypothetical protein